MTLADAIIAENIEYVRQLLLSGETPNQIDEYGFTPLIEAAIANNIHIAKLLLEQGANPNIADMTGGTALHWAVENNNLVLCQLLLSYHANPNAYTLSGQPVLAMSLLREHHKIKEVLLSAGADLKFAQDYVNTKLLGHMFELVGIANIIDPQNQFVEVDFEGFYLEISIAMIADSLSHYKNHFASRHMRQYGNLAQHMVNVLSRAARLITFQQYRVNVEKHTDEIQTLIRQEPLIIPVGYEGHAITFVKMGNILVKCDRREESRLYDNIFIYHIGNTEIFTPAFMMELMYEKQSSEFINETLPKIAALEPLTEIKIAAQKSGNCSWANVEACIPTLYFLLSTIQPDFEKNIPHYKTIAINYFNQWRDWYRSRALHFCIESMKDADSLRRKCKAEILAAILYQSACVHESLSDERTQTLLNILLQPEFNDILQNYIRIYSYEDASEEGKRFLQLLKEHGYTPQRKG